MYAKVALRSVRQCEEKLVRGEGFTTEEVFATVPAQTLTAAYFEKIGITALGLQQHLIAVHSQLGGARTGTGSDVKGKMSRLTILCVLWVVPLNQLN